MRPWAVSEEVLVAAKDFSEQGTFNYIPRRSSIFPVFATFWVNGRYLQLSDMLIHRTKVLGAAEVCDPTLSCVIEDSLTDCQLGGRIAHMSPGLPDLRT